jgi:hypothetical protein
MLEPGDANLGGAGERDAPREAGRNQFGAKVLFHQENWIGRVTKCP